MSKSADFIISLVVRIWLWLSSLTRGGQLPPEWWPMWLWWWDWWAWCPWWLLLCCEWWLSGLALWPWPKADIIFFWPGMLLACIRAMLDSTASQPSNPAWQHKQQHVRTHRGSDRTPHRDEESVGLWRWAWEMGDRLMQPWWWFWRWKDFHWPISYGLEQNCWNGVSSPWFECLCIWGDRGGLHSGWEGDKRDHNPQIIRGQSLKIEAYGYMTRYRGPLLICPVYQLQ